MVGKKTLHHPIGAQLKAYDYPTLQTQYNERLTHRGGLLSIAHLMDSLSFTEPPPPARMIRPPPMPVLTRPSPRAPASP